MRVADLDIVERFERLTRHQIIECAVYTAISNALCMILFKVVGVSLEALPFCAIWNFHYSLGAEMGYASDKHPLSYVVVGAVAFVIGVVMYVALLLVAS